MKPSLLFGALVVLSLCLGSGRPSSAAVYVVDQAGDVFNSASDCTTPVLNNCNLREAVEAANNNVGVVDTIRLPNTTLMLTIPRAGSNDNQSGDLDITEPVVIEPQLGALPSIDAGGVGGMGDRVFHVHASAGQTIIREIGIRNGHPPSGETGGAVLVDAGADLRIEDGQITGSVGNSGGGIAVSAGATVTVDGTEISGNGVTQWGGGGIACSGTLTVQDAVVRNNVGGSDGGGIAVSNGCTAVIDRSEISGNSAVNGFLGASGGGISVGPCGVAALSNVTVSENKARLNGGGLYMAGGFGFCPPGLLSANNVTIAFNQADFDGNGSGTGGGVYEAPGCSGFPTRCTTFENSIIAKNKTNGSNDDCAGDPVNTTGYNMLNSGLCPVSSVQATDDPADPVLDPVLALNAGGWSGIVNLTSTHGLIAGTPTNPAIDSGNPATCETNDQRGVARVGTCDRGAFEADVCGNSVVRDPEQCDPVSPLCSSQCRTAIPADHNNPFSTVSYRAGLVVAYDACLFPPTGLTDSVSTKAACNVVSSDPAGVCGFDSTSSSAAGQIDVTPSGAGGGKIDFHLKLTKLTCTSPARQFRMRISLEETVADCSGLPPGSTDSCTIDQTLLEDVVPGSCTVSATGTCEYTTTFNSTSLGHKVANGHRTSVAIREIKVVDAVSNADAFETGVLVK